ncbi:gamma-butyrobetaine dioxygenase-like isoform X3 [Oscarella lobularis]|uniref:gamma-butyrobetaine dioxygenase-like isoform X3 n=1 Tax=Oscarella lobularis TaxID=121494 RepID=UPI003313E41B
MKVHAGLRYAFKRPVLVRFASQTRYVRDRERAQVISAKADIENRLLTIQCSKGLPSYRLPFAYIWEQRNSGNRRRPADDRRAIATPPTHVEVAPNKRLVRVQWSTNETTELDVDWLNEHFVSKPNDFSCPFSGDAKRPELWGSEYRSNVTTFDFERILEDDDYVRKFLSKLQSRGLVMIKGAKAQSGELNRLCRQLGPAKTTLYGDLIKILSVNNSSNVAFTTRRFELHADYSDLTYPPEWFFLHCIHQLSNPLEGSGWYCDGFAVANHMKKEYPESFHMLSNTTISYRDVAVASFIGRFDTKSCSPLLCLHENGKVKRLILSNHNRDARFIAKNKRRLFGWYEAYYRFMELATDPRFLVNVKLEPEYKQSEGELRYLEALHFDRDIVYSKLRAKMARK